MLLPLKILLPILLGGNFIRAEFHQLLIKVRDLTSDNVILVNTFPHYTPQDHKKHSASCNINYPSSSDNNESTTHTDKGLQCEEHKRNSQSIRGKFKETVRRSGEMALKLLSMSMEFNLQLEVD